MFQDKSLSERERLELDINSFFKVFNKEYDKKNKRVEEVASRVLLQYIFDLIKRLDSLEGNRWFKFKTKRKLQDAGVSLAQAEKWEML